VRRWTAKRLNTVQFSIHNARAQEQWICLSVVFLRIPKADLVFLHFPFSPNIINNTYFLYLTSFFLHGVTPI
jgi:hypothetical protein